MSIRKLVWLLCGGLLALFAAPDARAQTKQKHVIKTYPAKTAAARAECAAWGGQLTVRKAGGDPLEYLCVRRGVGPR